MEPESSRTGGVTKAGRRCIFCGGTPVTREHVWPQWMSKLDDASQLRQEIRRERPRYRLRGEPGTPESSLAVEMTGRPRDHASMVVKAACASCNNGWMAELEDMAKPVLLRQMRDRTNTLSPEERDTVVRWLMKTTAVWEMEDVSGAVLPDAERRQIAAGLPDSDWMVYALWSPREESMFGLWHLGMRTETEPETDTSPERLVQMISVGHAIYVLRWMPGTTPHRGLPFGSLPKIQLWPEQSRNQERESLNLQQFNKLEKKLFFGRWRD